MKVAFMLEKSPLITQQNPRHGMLSCLTGLPQYHFRVIGLYGVNAGTAGILATSWQLAILHVRV